MFLNLSRYRKSKVFLIILSLFILHHSTVQASENPRVKDIRYWSSPEYTRVVIDLTEPVAFSRNRLTNPDRIYFDLKNTTIEKEMKTSLPVGDGVLKTVRASQFNNVTVRVVLDIEELSDFKSIMIDNPARLIIDLYGAPKMTEKSEKSSGIEKPEKHEKPVKTDLLLVKRRIVIDAGHGGHDPGAVGPRKLYEKDVVLDIALKLRKILMKDPLNEIFLTRDKDIFIPLEQRTAIANKKNADLFVSIHANASPGRAAKGIETYLLNWTDDEGAMSVAARENAISLKKMKAMNSQLDIVEIIKSDLFRENKRDESIKLANHIQRSLVSNLEDNYESVTDLGVKQALFYVLFGAKMPSVLVEVSFISNPVEEILLSQESYRLDIARSIAEGLNTYINTTPVIQKVAEATENKSLYR